MSAGLLADRLRVPPSSLSFHLRALENAGLITQHRLSRQIIYAAEFSTMNDLVVFLTKNCCGQAESCAPVCNPGAVPVNAAEDRAAPAGVRRQRS